MESQIQTLVVHVSQLTTENMLVLAQAGYTHLDDPKLLIFGRQATPEATPGEGETAAGEVLAPPTSITGRGKNSKH